MDYDHNHPHKTKSWEATSWLQVATDEFQEFSDEYNYLIDQADVNTAFKLFVINCVLYAVS